MGSILDAMKKSGINVSTKPEVKQISIGDDIKLPFSVRYVSNNTMLSMLHNMNTLLSNWESVDMQYLDQFDCSEGGEDIKDFLKKHYSKVRVFVEEDAGGSIPLEPTKDCRYFQFKYDISAKIFVCEIQDDFNFDSVCFDNDIIPSSFDISNTKAKCFYLGEETDIIPLSITNYGVLHYPEIPFTYETIQKHKRAMMRLSTWLNSCDRKPNPKSKYFICQRGGIGMYYLKKFKEEK